MLTAAVDFSAAVLCYNNKKVKSTNLGKGANYEKSIVATTARATISSNGWKAATDCASLPT